VDVAAAAPVSAAGFATGLQRRETGLPPKDPPSAAPVG
jgi:hypothetical protein